MVETQGSQHPKNGPGTTDNSSFLDPWGAEIKIPFTILEFMLYSLSVRDSFHNVSSSILWFRCVSFVGSNWCGVHKFISVEQQAKFEQEDVC